MGFFSKKKPTSNAVHDMVDAKIRTMRHDLEEIAKNGRIQVDEPFEEPGAPKEKTSAEKEKKFSSDSPFFQSEPVVPETPVISDVPLPKEDIKETLLPEETKEKVTLSKEGREIEESDLKLQQAELPIAPPTPPSSTETFAQKTPQQIPLSPLPPKEDETEFTPPEEKLKQLEKKQESLRTGVWPMRSLKKKTFDAKPLASKTLPKKVSIRKATLDKKPLPDNIILKERWGWKHYFALIIILAALGGGAFFFRKTRFQEMTFPKISLPALPDIASNPKAEELRVEPEPKENLPFSTAHSNTFLIDVETESVSTLREKLLKNAKDMSAVGIESPIRFSVVDKTNTPIAFFIFASVFNLGLSADLLNSLDNDFSLWIFLDRGAPRLVLSVNIKHADNVNTFISASEKSLPVSLKNLFLTEAEAPLEKVESAFGDGIYRGVAIRYLNFQSETPLSLDYGVIRSTLIVGTSKDSTRAVIDTILGKEE